MESVTGACAYYRSSLHLLQLLTNPLGVGRVGPERKISLERPSRLGALAETTRREAEPAPSLGVRGHRGGDLAVKTSRLLHMPERKRGRGLLEGRGKRRCV